MADDEFRALVAALGAVIDEDQARAVIKNDLGEFQVQLRTGAISYRPFFCDLCKNPCEDPYDDLCFHDEGPGWSNASLDAGQLAILSKIHVIQNNLYPLDLLEERASTSCIQDRRKPLARRLVYIGDLREWVRANRDRLGASFFEFLDEIERAAYQRELDLMAGQYFSNVP